MNRILPLAFSGRLFFDHLPKTGGTAVTKWLRDSLGSGCVTSGHLWGRNRDLIQQFGGRFSVISAHAHFRPGDGFDPRYRYVTLLREPIDRTLSWLYFTIENPGHETAAHERIAPAVLRFVESEGREVDERLLDDISNVYCKHFAEVLEGDGRLSEGRVADSLTALQSYSVAGIYEEMPAFVGELGALVGLPPPAALPHAHVTVRRPAVKDISPGMRERIAGLNELDLQLYRAFVEWKQSPSIQARAEGGVGAAMPLWDPYEAPKRRRFTVPEVTLKSASIQGGNAHRQGELACFELVFELNQAFENLEVGIHLHDDLGRVAFGSNTTRLRCPSLDPREGVHTARFYLALDLPIGEYTAGFAVAVVAPAAFRQLAWIDDLVTFHVLSPVDRHGVGFTEIPAEVSCIRVPPR